MTDLRLMCVLAHPDDESLGTGGILARYSAEGLGTYVVSATRGEHGWFGSQADYPGPAALGTEREGELRAAARVLGVQDVQFLDYEDGFLDQADQADVVAKIVAQIRRWKPQVVVSFGPDGAYGHPDHIAICQFTTAAVVAAADQAYGAGAPHTVAKLYYMADTDVVHKIYESVFGKITMRIDGVERGMASWEAWAVSATIDSTAHWRTVWQAVQCHRTQLAAYSLLESISEEGHMQLWGRRSYFRAISRVNGGRALETDLFEGLR